MSDMTTASLNERAPHSLAVVGMENVISTQPKHRRRKMRQVGTPSNPSRFLRDGARYGAIRITDKHGATRYYLGAPTHYRDANGVYQAPLFAPTDTTLARRFVASQEMGQLD